MLNETILKYLEEHPNVGRVRLKNLFGISERDARTHIAVARTHADTKSDPIKDERNVAIGYLKSIGLSPDSVDKLLTPKQVDIMPIVTGATGKFKIGVIGDTHLGDKSCALAELHDYYHRCYKLGIEHVVHAGDLFAGMNVYKGQVFDLNVHGYVDQLQFAIDNYPKYQGITTYVISGNHDMSFKALAGANIMEALSAKRKDIVFLGEYDGAVSINGVKIGLHHGDGGNAYATSYKLQKFIEKIGAGKKPQIYVLGHYHTALTMFYRNIHAILPCCFQKPTDFSTRKGLPNMIGGYILEIEAEKQEPHSIISIGTKLIAYYD